MSEQKIKYAIAGLGLAATITAGIAGFYLGKDVANAHNNATKTTIEYKLINNDKVLDQIVTDRKNNESYVMLNGPNDTYEKCDITPNKERGRWIVSYKDSMSYGIDSGEKFPIHVFK